MLNFSLYIPENREFSSDICNNWKIILHIVIFTLINSNLAMLFKLA